MFLNKNRDTISKIAPKMSLERGRRYLKIINSVFLLPPHRKSFENEIAPLKTHIPKIKILQFAQKASIFSKVKKQCGFSKALFRFQSFPDEGAIKRRY